MMRKHTRVYITSSAIPKLQDGVGLLSREGSVYPGLKHKDGVSIHPPVTMKDKSYFFLLIEWMIQNHLRVQEAHSYNLAHIDASFVNVRLSNLSNDVDEFPTIEELEDESGLKISQSHLNKGLRWYGSSSADELIDRKIELQTFINRQAEKLTSWYVQNFVRIRDGGMYTFQEQETLYLRISSTGHDWTQTIKRYLEDTFGVSSQREVWIGVDEDNRGSARAYFQGTIEYLLAENLETKIWSGEHRRKFPMRRSRFS